MSITCCLNIEPWVNKRVGFTPDLHAEDDPDRYVANIRRQQEIVREYFAGERYVPFAGDAIEPPCVNLGSMIVKGELLGIQVDPKSGAALSHPWCELETVAQVEALRIPDIRQCPGYAQKLRKYRDLAARFDGVIPGRRVGFLWGQCGKAIASPMNMVFDLVGEEVFVRMLTDPELVHAYFRKVMDIHAMLWEVKREVEGQDFTSSYLADCTNTMLSPETFVEFALPRNREFAQRFPRLESHNCGVVTHLLAHIAAYGPFQWVEIGWGTDLSRAREFFGESVLLMPRLGVNFMQSFTPEQVYARTVEILHQTAAAGPVCLHSNCICPDRTREETLRTLFAAVADFEAGAARVKEQP